MLFKYFGKVIAQPRRDLFEKATSLRVSQSSSMGFMTRVEAEAAMELANQAELISAHADWSALTVKPTFNKKSKGRGGGKGGGRKGLPLRLLPQQQRQRQRQRQQQQQQQPCLDSCAGARACDVRSTSSSVSVWEAEHSTSPSQSYWNQRDGLLERGMVHAGDLLLRFSLGTAVSYCVPPSRGEGRRGDAERHCHWSLPRSLTNLRRFRSFSSQ